MKIHSSTISNLWLFFTFVTKFAKAASNVCPQKHADLENLFLSTFGGLQNCWYQTIEVAELELMKCEAFPPGCVPEPGAEKCPESESRTLTYTYSIEDDPFVQGGIFQRGTFNTRLLHSGRVS